MSKLAPSLLIDAFLQTVPESAAVINVSDKLVAYRADALRMQAMGCAQLPVDTIAVPEEATWFAHKTQEPAQTQRCQRLRQFLPAHVVAALVELQSIFKMAGYDAYVIGGVVRDMFVDEDRLRPVQDLDLTIAGDAIACAHAMVRYSKNIQLQAIYENFGTAKILYRDELAIDLASTRVETYTSCGALPQVVERGVPLAQDIARRDVTMNTLALSVNALGEIFDHTGALEDIEARQIHLLHTASFWEDPSRILRVLKFAARFDFELSPATERLMQKFLQYGKAVYPGGGERIAQESCELLTSLTHPAVGRAWEQLRQSDAYRLWDMQLKPRDDLSTLAKFQDNLLKTAAQNPETPLLQHSEVLWPAQVAVYLLQHDEPSQVHACERLCLARSTRQVLEQLVEIENAGFWDDLNEESSAVDVDEAFSGLQQSTLLAAVLLHPNRNILWPMLLHYQEHLAPLQPVLGGDDLQALGFEKGPGIGQALKALRQARLLGQVASRADEVTWIRVHYPTAKQSSPTNTGSTHD